VANNPIEQQWEAIQTQVKKSLESNFPIEGSRNNWSFIKLLLMTAMFRNLTLSLRKTPSYLARHGACPCLCRPELKLIKATGNQLDRTKDQGHDITEAYPALQLYRRW
jgi:hypothetical protein